MLILKTRTLFIYFLFTFIIYMNRTIHITLHIIYTLRYFIISTDEYLLLFISNCVSIFYFFISLELQSYSIILKTNFDIYVFSHYLLNKKKQINDRINAF